MGGVPKLDAKTLKAGVDPKIENKKKILALDTSSSMVKVTNNRPQFLGSFST